MPDVATEPRWTIDLGREQAVDRDVVGGKAESLWRMRRAGVRVPPAFVVTVDACRAYFADGQRLGPDVEREIRAAVGELERATGRRLGDERAPLLLSVRSGAAVSMPGMMDTVLNLGMNDDVERALAGETGSARFAADTHRRFCELYGRVVLGAHTPSVVDADAATVRAAVRDAVGTDVPVDPWAQLLDAVAAVFRSSNSRRARTYRAHYGLPQDLGTAVTIQAMVFGNLDERSGTGVLFTRNPLDGTPEVYGEYLAGGQGEDVVSGERTPEPLSALADAMPDAHREILAWGADLERQERDVQDIEFTVQSGVAYLLQARAAKRSAAAAARIAVDLVDAGTLTVDEALGRLTVDQMRVILMPQLAPGAADGQVPRAEGVPACQGVGRGAVVTSSDEAVRRTEAGESVVLVTATTSPEDLHGMMVAAAIVTGRGGSTSHAAVVGRALGKPCVVGAGDEAVAALTGRTVTVDGGEGRVYDGELLLTRVDERRDPRLARIAGWAAERTAVVVVSRDDDADRPWNDLDADERGREPATLAALVAPGDAVRGAILDTDEGLTAAVDAGATTVACGSPVTALIALVAHERSGS